MRLLKLFLTGKVFLITWEEMTRKLTPEEDVEMHMEDENEK